MRILITLLFVVVAFNISAQVQQLVFDSVYQVDNATPNAQSVYEFQLTGCSGSDSLAIYFDNVDSCDQYLLEYLQQIPMDWQTVVYTGCVGVYQFTNPLNPQGPQVFSGQLYPDGFDPVTGMVTGWSNATAFSPSDYLAFSGSPLVMLPGVGSGIIRFAPIPGQYRLTVTNHPSSMTDWGFVMPSPPFNPVIIQAEEFVCDSLDAGIDTLSGNCDTLWIVNRTYTPISVTVSPEITCWDGEPVQLHAQQLPLLFGSTSVWSDQTTGGATIVTAAGTYSVTVTTSNGCTATDEVVVPEQLELQLDAVDPTCRQVSDGEILPIITGGTIPYSIGLDSLGGELVGLPVGNYLVTVTDANGCTATAETELLAECCPDLVYDPNAFSPNGDGINDSFTLYGPVGTQILELHIFDQWGGEVFRQYDFPAGTGGWDGTPRGQIVNSDVYTWWALVKTGDCIVRVMGSVNSF